LCPAAERTQHGVEHQVEFLPDVFCQKAKNEVVVLLKELVLASIPAVRHGVREVLGTVQFDRDARGRFVSEILYRPQAERGRRRTTGTPP